MSRILRERPGRGKSFMISFYFEYNIECDLTAQSVPSLSRLNRRLLARQLVRLEGMVNRET